MSDSERSDETAGEAKRAATQAAKPARKRSSRSKSGSKSETGSAAPSAAKASPSAAPAANFTPALFVIDFAVRWRDLDAFNHVNNATFLTYLEEARLRWLESLDGPWLSETCAPVLAAAELQFRRPIPWPETLRIELRALRVGQSSLTLGHRIGSAGDASAVYSEGSTVMVWVDAASGKGAALPEAVRRHAEGAGA